MVVETGSSGAKANTYSNEQQPPDPLLLYACLVCVTVLWTYVRLTVGSVGYICHIAVRLHISSK